jgi:hypothetical protein
MKKILWLVPMILLVEAGYAQDLPKAELFGGFSYSRGNIDLNMYGWNASIAGDVNQWFSIVGDFSGNYGKFNYSNSNVSLHSFAGGPQFTFRTKRIAAFSRVMLGGIRIGVGSSNTRETNFALTIGGGIDVSLSKRFAFRAIQADWTRFHDSYNWVYNQGRLSTGLVVRF